MELVIQNWTSLLSTHTFFHAKDSRIIFIPEIIFCNRYIKICNNTNNICLQTFKVKRILNSCVTLGFWQDNNDNIESCHFIHTLDGYIVSFKCFRFRYLTQTNNSLPVCSDCVISCFVIHLFVWSIINRRTSDVGGIGYHSVYINIHYRLTLQLLLTTH